MDNPFHLAGFDKVKWIFCITFAAMFDRLKQKWKVNGWQLLLILITFALGGSLCGWLGRQALGWFNIEQTAVRIPLYILLVTLLWPFCVLVISVPFGQFIFFKKYLRKIFRRMSGRKRETDPENTKTVHMPNDGMLK